MPTLANPHNPSSTTRSKKSVSKQATRKASKPERLEARVTAEQKQLLQKAADLQGRSLTDFIVSAAYQAATQTVLQSQILELSLQDREAFAAAVLNPPAPNEKLKAAFRRYHGQ